MCIKIYFPITDIALTELRRRFSDGNIAILRVVCALMPGTENFLDADVLQPTAAPYKCKIDDLNRLQPLAEADEVHDCMEDN